MQSVAVPWMNHFAMEQGLMRELVRSAKSGDPAAFERLVIIHERTVLRVAQRLLLNSEDAKDAAQEAFIRLHRSLRNFEEDRELGPWLYRVTVNICRDVARRSRRSVCLGEAESVESKERGPEAAAVAAQQKRMIVAAIAALTQREREIIVLRDLEGRSTKEIAGIVGACEGTVRSHLSAGRVKIKNHIAGLLRKQP
ncbi:MAG: sigma-70 family RNA polymerase sigma factor [Acidobacteriaceae bacterium]|nr:sigma-70 family RNA polymerase sigma factor [Acidobacteriaceae bacterium]